MLIDLAGNGFRLTDPASGVLFDILATGVKRRVAWTAGDSDDAWLAPDRNDNGLIDDASELFGNHTPQPIQSGANGFLALAEYDRLAYGGNGDGVISREDEFWSLLRLWRDANHNGISEPSELLTLDGAGIVALEIKYQAQKWSDLSGNQFRYRAKVRTERDGTAGHWAFDVILRSVLP